MVKFLEAASGLEPPLRAMQAPALTFLATPPYLLALSNTASNFPHVTSWIQMGRHVPIWGLKGWLSFSKGYSEGEWQGSQKAPPAIHNGAVHIGDSIRSPVALGVALVLGL